MKNKKSTKKPETKKQMTDEELVIHAENSAVIFKLGGKMVDGLLRAAKSGKVRERTFALNIIRTAWYDQQHELQMASFRKLLNKF